MQFLSGSTTIIFWQYRAIRQEVSDRIFAPIQSLENEGILYVFQRVKKASQSLPPAGGKGILIIFCRGAPQGGLSCPFGAIHLLYLTENTTQAASLAPQRCAERNRRRRLLARSCAICTPKAYKSCARQTAILLSKKGKALFRQSRILYVFLVFQTEEVGQKDGGDSQTQLCGGALLSHA